MDEVTGVDAGAGMGEVAGVRPCLAPPRPPPRTIDSPTANANRHPRRQRTIQPAIAQRLVISVRTVENPLYHATTKLGTMTAPNSPLYYTATTPATYPPGEVSNRS